VVEQLKRVDVYSVFDDPYCHNPDDALCKKARLITCQNRHAFNRFYKQWPDKTQLLLPPVELNKESFEAKVTAEQTALAAKNKLEQVKYEADQKVAEAEGKAKALKVESEAISNDPKILELRAIEKWNGVLPVYNGGGAVPFVNIK
jgi:hypothetical protein